MHKYTCWKALMVVFAGLYSVRIEVYSSFFFTPWHWSLLCTLVDSWHEAYFPVLFHVYQVCTYPV